MFWRTLKHFPGYHANGIEKWLRSSSSLYLRDCFPSNLHFVIVGYPFTELDILVHMSRGWTQHWYCKLVTRFGKSACVELPRFVQKQVCHVCNYTYENANLHRPYLRSFLIKGVRFQVHLFLRNSLPRSTARTRKRFNAPDEFTQIPQIR